MYAKWGYERVKSWTRREDIFSKDILLIPIHLGNHWTLVIVDLQLKQINYMNSLGHRNDVCLALVLRYLVEEARGRKLTHFDVEQWHLSNVSNLPRQTNNYDCGVFALNYGEYTARNARFTFTQADVPYFRRRMMFGILQSAPVLSENGQP